MLRSLHQGPHRLAVCHPGGPEELGVRTELENEWARLAPDLAEEAEHRARRVTAKAWRFAGEMDEIASTFESADLHGGFHRAAREVFQRLAGFKDAESCRSWRKCWLRC